MLVKKYQGQSLDEALKAVKADLGVEAIILKTEKFSGLKGALSNRRYEVTAGIEGALEENHNLEEEERNVFSQHLQESAAERKHEIEQQLVIQKEREEQIKHMALETEKRVKQSQALEESINDKITENETYINELNLLKDKIEVQLDEQNEIILDLRKEMTLLKNQMQSFEVKKDFLLELKTNLRSFDLSESLISDILTKMRFEAQGGDKLNDQQVHDIVLREVTKIIKTSPSRFTLTDYQNKPFINIFLSSGCSGQTSMTYKVSQFSSSPFIVTYGDYKQEKSFHTDLLNVPNQHCSNLQSLVKCLNEQYSEGRQIFIDLKSRSENKDETKRIVQAIKGSFQNVDVNLSLSGIHSETYNLKECHRYGDIIDAITVSFLDLSLNLTSLANLQHKVDFAYTFFGIGPLVPTHIEEASAKRVLLEIFENSI